MAAAFLVGHRRRWAFDQLPLERTLVADTERARHRPKKRKNVGRLAARLPGSSVRFRLRLVSTAIVKYSDAATTNKARGRERTDGPDMIPRVSFADSRPKPRRGPRSSVTTRAG